MTTDQTSNIPKIGCWFAIEGQFLDAHPYGFGHINETYAASYQTLEGIRRYVFQQINTQVFKNPEKVMQNALTVTQWIRQKILASGGDPSRKCLHFIPTRDGTYCFQYADGSYWRVYELIEGAHTYETPQNLYHVYTAARAYAEFQHHLSELPTEKLCETIPDFHNTPLRFSKFLQVLQEDPFNRASQVKSEIRFILNREEDTKIISDQIATGRVPPRIAHNDTKLNNVLIDDRSGEGICVIDLDTTMPGSSLYDFGDLVRSGATSAAEDEPDLEKVNFDLQLFEHIAKGYLEIARLFLTPLEISLLPLAAKIITLEQAIRFLTDYLSGDVYYKIRRPNHNLDRARTQIKLVSSIENQMENLVALVEKYAKE